MVAPALAVLIVMAAVFVRQTDVPKHRTMWAEDGRVFAQCLFDRPALECLTQPYQGYLLTVPRLAAMVGTAGPPVRMPSLFTLMAALVAAWCAAMVALAIRDVSASTIAGVLAGASLGLVWQAGREVLGNITNVNAVMLTASVVVLLCGWLGRRLRPWDLALIAATALSSPLALLLPVLAVGPVVARTRRARRDLALIAGFAIPQTIVLITATRVVPPGEVTLTQAVTGYRDLVLGQGWFGGGSPVPDVVVPLALLGFVVALLLLARLPGRDTPEASGQRGDEVGVGARVEFGSRASPAGARCPGGDRDRDLHRVRRAESGGQPEVRLRGGGHDRDRGRPGGRVGRRRGTRADAPAGRRSSGRRVWARRPGRTRVVWPAPDDSGR